MPAVLPTRMPSPDRDQHRGEADRQRDAPAIQHAREQILPQIIRAERMREGRPLQHRAEVDVVDRHLPVERADQHCENEQHQHHGADHRKPVLAEAAPCLLPRPDMRGGWRG
jgi:hypothetical protein